MEEQQNVASVPVRKKKPGNDFRFDNTRKIKWAREWRDKLTKYEWNAEKRQFLIDNWETMTDEQMAKELNVSVHLLVEKRQNLSLLRKRGRHKPAA